MVRLLRFTWPLLLGILIALVLLKPAFAQPAAPSIGSLVIHLEGQQVRVVNLLTIDLRTLVLASTPVLIPTLLAGVTLGLAHTLTLLNTHILPLLPKLIVMTVGLVSFGGWHRKSENPPEATTFPRASTMDELREIIRDVQVVLTDSTHSAHFAAALRYDRKIDSAPMLLAKGQGATALTLCALAEEHRVPVLTYPMLARALYYTGREGQEIRDDLYVAIATVLAFVFSTHLRAGGSPPAIEVPVSARFDKNGRNQHV